MIHFKTWQKDLPAGLVVFLVALPLCLGVGLASTSIEGITGLPNLFSGLVAGIVGGVVVGLLSGSRLGVSGPAAGLITIIVAAINTLGSYEAFLVAVVISGILQLIAGFLKAGIIANYIPSSVIKGMLAAIGITLILKEIPHLVGFDKDFFGDESFWQKDGHNTFSEIYYSLQALHPGAIIIGVISIGILILFDTDWLKKNKILSVIPGALIVVIVSILLNKIFGTIDENLKVTNIHLVQLPVPKSINDFFGFFSFPDFSFLKNPNVYIIAFTIALVGSLETLLSVEATDKLDPLKFSTPTNRELKAQGIGNIISGLLGGLPITQVIVRSSANINSGGQSKLSTIVHGLLIFVAIVFIPQLLNMIPLAALAAVLIMVGYKLSKISLFKSMYQLGWEQFIPFAITIIGVLLTDLLKGIGIGLAISIFYILRKNYKNNFKKEESNNEIKVTLSEEVTFLNKAGIIEILESVPKNSKLIIDGSYCKSIDYDVIELLSEFQDFGSKNKNIQLQMINIHLKN
jgi:MFS superfamily sulfate permease-like transporter